MRKNSVGEVTTGMRTFLRLLPRDRGDTMSWLAGYVDIRHNLMQFLCPVILKLERSILAWQKCPRYCHCSGDNRGFFDMMENIFQYIKEARIQNSFLTCAYS
jgi:hypothetical protein